MKKVLLACVLTVAMVLSLVPAVTVHAEVQEGLMSTWYQVPNDDGEPRVDHGGPINGILGDISDLDGINDLLKYDELMVVGEILVPTFEIAGGPRQAGFNVREYAKKEGMSVVGQDGGDDVNDLLIVFQGSITAPETADYTFISSWVDNGCIIEIDGKIAFEFWQAGDWRDSDDPASEHGEPVEGDTTIHMEKGVAYPITVLYSEQGGGEVLSMDVSINGADKVQFNTVGFTFSYDPDAIPPEPTPTPTPDPTPTPEETPTPEATATQAPTTAPAATTAAGSATNAASTGAPTSTSDTTTEQTGDSTGLIIAIVAIVVVAAAAVITFVVIKKKKK